MGKILVTGGAGFIGTHLCRELIKRGNQVISLDLRAAAYPVPGVQYIEGDVLNRTLVRNLLTETTAVFHLAAMASVVLCQENPAKSLETNLLSVSLMAEEILEQEKKSGTKIRMIFSGSSVVYGNSLTIGRKSKESDPLPLATSHYGVHKLGAEQQLKLLASNRGLEAVAFRFFNVYGEGQAPSSPYSGVITIFSKIIAENGTILLNNNGINTRDFISVKDIVDGCILASTLPYTEALFGPFNLGTGQATSIAELAQVLDQISEKNTKTVKNPPREADVLHSCADITRAQQILTWSPKVKLVTGLCDLILEKTL